MTTLPFGSSSSDEPRSARPAAPVETGELVANRYRIDRIVAWGGMGVICSAEDIALGTRVAIKILRGDLARQPSLDARLVNEARAIGTLRSDHVARLFDVGRLDSGLPYFVMEYLEGPTLDVVLKARGPLPVETAVAYVLDACEALADAHTNGVTHRDVKPENLVLFCANGAATVKLIDFGIAKALSDSASLTRPGESIGSPCYMSPEQIVSACDVDGRADIWSLGVVLYELLAGARPFDGGSLAEICSRVLHAPVPSVRAKRPDVPARLEHAILRCLERTPSRRFQTMAELRREIAPYAPRALVSPISEPPPARDGAPMSQTFTPTSRMLSLAAAAAFLVALLGFVVVRLSLADASPQREPAPLELDADVFRARTIDPKSWPALSVTAPSATLPRPSGESRGPAHPVLRPRTHRYHVSGSQIPSRAEVERRKRAYERYLQQQRLRRVGDIRVRVKSDGTTELVE